MIAQQTGLEHATHAIPTAFAGAASAEEMDAMHEAVVKAFPAKTEGVGNLPLKPRIEKGTKVFELTAKAVQWEVKPGSRIEAFAYNGVVPGPIIRVRQGDRLRVILKNELPESTAIHWHGVMVPNKMDGVPYVTQPPIKSGQTFVYEFVARNPGTHTYHSHHAADIQVPKGLLGAFIIDPKDSTREPRVAQDVVMILQHSSHAPAWHADEGHYQGRMAGSPAVHVRYAEPRPRGAL
ncbi:MAG: multicopper oxidase domain-containing protein [bacterium]